MNTPESRLHNSRIIDGIACLFSISFFIAAGIGMVYTGLSLQTVLTDWVRIMTSPGPLVTDYFRLGSLPAAFLNAGACGISMCFFMIRLQGNSHANTLAGFFLVIAHCFYGLNFLNMWPCFFAPMIYMWMRNLNVKQNLHICMFATCFSPFIGEFLFRYTLKYRFVPGEVRITGAGLILALLFTLLIAFVIPAILPGAQAWHKGYNLYNGGLAFGLFGFLVYNFMYKTLDVPKPLVINYSNELYEAVHRSYRGFATVYFLIIFLICLIAGWILNEGTFYGYADLIRTTGYQCNYARTFGMDLVLINIGFYGLFFFLYVFLIITFTPGAGFTGPTIGVVIASLTFTALGQHPRNIWPILCGYLLLYTVATVISNLTGNGLAWSVSTQSYINGAAFATGLCPICGRYGKRAGIAAGFLCAAMCTATGALHGGLVLYNGGFTDGITAMLLLPILEHYLPAPREDAEPTSVAMREQMTLTGPGRTRLKRPFRLRRKGDADSKEAAKKP